MIALKAVLHLFFIVFTCIFHSICCLMKFAEGQWKEMFSIDVLVTFSSHCFSQPILLLEMYGFCL